MNKEEQCKYTVGKVEFNNTTETLQICKHNVPVKFGCSHCFESMQINEPTSPPIAQIQKLEAELKRLNQTMNNHSDFEKKQTERHIYQVRQEAHDREMVCEGTRQRAIKLEERIKEIEARLNAQLEIFEKLNTLDECNLERIKELEVYIEKRITSIHDILDRQGTLLSTHEKGIDTLSIRISALLVNEISAAEMFEKFNYPKIRERLEKLERSSEANLTCATMVDNNNIKSFSGMLERLEKLEKWQQEHNYVSIIGFNQPVQDCSQSDDTKHFDGVSYDALQKSGYEYQLRNLQKQLAEKDAIIDDNKKSYEQLLLSTILL